jgi:hypothetical protein
VLLQSRELLITAFEERLVFVLQGRPTDRPRLIALFSYDERPGMVFPEATVRDLMNSSPETYYGQPG